MTVHRKWDKLTINARALGILRVKHWCWLVTGDKFKRVEGLEQMGLTLYQFHKQSKKPATMGRLDA